MVQVSPMSGEERDELREAASSVDLEAVEDLHELLEAVRSGEVSLDDDAVFHLGVFFGESLRRVTGWKWRQVRLGEGLEAPGLVSKDHGLVCLPLQWLAEVVEGLRANDVLETFERLERGDRPGAEPGSLALFVGAP